MNDEEITGYKCFLHHTALKLHFTDPSYDAIKYHGKINCPYETYLSRKDYKQFERLARKAKRIDSFTDFVIASLLRDRVYGADLIQDEDAADDDYLRYRKVMDSLTHTFKEDLEYLLSKTDSFDDLFKFDKRSDYPLVFHEYLNENITVQTLTILNRLFKLVDIFDKELADDYLWNRTKLKITKYQPLLFREINPEQYSKIKDIVRLNIEWTSGKTSSGKNGT